ncbi:YheC/YheD family protein [Gracilibacillus sp. HCP3S3_G5_2]|uniref:YheC/YheD family protein n=1 Tax=Gracilibacillus sp. HCP3S3_G5_2 TaxID=3438941 RepID=UPI003F89731C
MSNLNDQQLKQIQHISSTLLEAVEHLTTVIKKKEMNDAIFTMSSIVDGFSSINRALSQEEIGKEERDKIENSLFLVVKELEQMKFVKVSEIVQFTLKPQLKRWNDLLNASINTAEDSERILIGVYLCHKNPREVYPDDRILALLEEGEKQGTKVIFFSSKDVDFEKNEILADVYKNGEWIKEINPFPDVINNLPKVKSQQSYTERKLRRQIPFTGFGLDGKLTLPKKLIESRKFHDLIIPFRIADKEEVVHQFLQEHHKAVLKPIRGRQGKNIYFVEKKENNYVVLDHKKKRSFSIQDFSVWLQNHIFEKDNLYMVQHFLKTSTIHGEPYDIRAHVQKNRYGQWQITKMYPRIGNKKSILSNISRGGRTEEIGKFLQDEFGSKGVKIEQELQELSLDITKHLDKLYGSALEELGLDLAIDDKGEYWMYEANAGPQSTYHERERAKNTIGYAIYIAENGLFLSNQFERKTTGKGGFNALTTSLPFAELEGGLVKIGMLVSPKEINKLTEACAYVAKYEGHYFYYFTARDIDYDERLIRGYFYENNEWVPKVVEYPDVIYDRLRARGLKGYNRIYEELEEIPFTNEFFGNSISKLEVYDKLSAIQSLAEYIIPYKRVNRAKEVFQYIEKYQKIILKPSIGSFAKGVHFIEKSKDGSYFLAEKDREEAINEFSLADYLHKLIKKQTFIVQKYINTRTLDGNPFDIRVHMMKNGEGEWSFVKIYPRIGVNYATISITRAGGYIGDISGFLERNYSKAISRQLIENIKSLSWNTVKNFEESSNENFSEIGLDIAIDKDNSLFLIEVNVNKPGIVNYEFEVAQYAIPYAIGLAQHHTDD